ncbi:sugar uptake ABC transporter ATP-binding protein [Gammaproteobacteria bacterium]|nr:sugar uptake ABC transporter ATP-binding protein [Gammaproteobacteria bacterium]
MLTKPIIEVINVAKRFGSVEALTDISLKIMQGRVHTLLGENGAGKSTLMKILAGIYPPSSGQVLLYGQPMLFLNPEQSRRAGIAIIYQELSLSRNMSVAENIYANQEPQRFGIINDKRLLKNASALLEDLGIMLDPAQPLSNLSMAQRQLVEIAKALSYPSQIVIMDEPTSSLSDNEAEILFKIIAKLKKQDKAIIYISHRMSEIMQISDDISILRDGRFIKTLQKDKCDINELIALMVGREMKDIYPPKIHKIAAETALQNQAILEVNNLHKQDVFNHISFNLHEGEILGFFGLVGAGRSDIMKALFGMAAYTGEISIKGKLVKIRHPYDAISQKIAFVTENRKEEGLSLAHSILNNINGVNFKQITHKTGIINRLKEIEIAQSAILKTSIKTSSMDELAGNLSGGNQQKIVLAKWLESKPHILILDEPTRGVDVGAKYEIYKIMRTLAASGTAIIMISSELPEVMALSDRLIVMREKHIVKQFDQMQGLTQEMIMFFATGVHSNKTNKRTS